MADRRAGRAAPHVPSKGGGPAPVAQQGRYLAQEAFRCREASKKQKVNPRSSTFLG